ncbi:hypothetical protein MVEN_02272300 [Mycena venus]|uniref:DUF6533 domain-containing protein n=1 Tax=Mycena venus TaxID=2733690 RepID=A0A8H6X5K3_9AGAR|nr:hypothetical protein MVEN_02272300 [Mycena venus]
MSHYSIDAADDAPLLDPATFAWELRLYRSVVLSGLVLLIYDYTLTLATEVKFIWAAKLRPSIYWFLVLRYIGLAANIANCVLYFADLSREVRVLCFLRFRLSTIFSQSCAKMQLMWRSLIVSQEMLVGCTLIMRVFAMYGRNWWILICLMAVSALLPAFALEKWDTIKEGLPQIYSVPVITGSGCATFIPRISTFRLAGAWESQIVCDILVFLLTVRRAYVQREMYPRYAGTLLWRMTTDGAVYFGLSITLLARLMLNLHEAAAVGMELNTIELETLRFATVQMTGDNGA